MGDGRVEVVLGIQCMVRREKFPDGRYRDVYRFTVPGWPECSTTGIRSAKRVIQRSILSGHVAKSCRFSPSSRAKIYENESRLSQLMNGFCAFSSFSRRFPTLSPCSRILQAKQIIVQAREQEAQGRLTESLKLYKEGDAEREDSCVAQEHLPENERLRKKVEEVEKQIEIIASVNGDGEQQQNEERVLQILNYAGLSGLLKLKTIGEAKARRILKERESGLFVSVDVSL